MYFDVCCLNRPFDDQTQDRVRLESIAVLNILKHVELDGWISVGSDAIQDEVGRDTDIDRRYRVQSYADLAQQMVTVQREQLTRAVEIQGMGFQPFDALHIACAEHAGVDAFLTTDDRLLRLSIRANNRLTVRVANPAVWLLEVQNDY